MLELNGSRYRYLLGKPLFKHHLHRRVPQHKSCHGCSTINLQNSQINLVLISPKFLAFNPPNNSFLSLIVDMAINYSKNRKKRESILPTIE